VVSPDSLTGEAMSPDERYGTITAKIWFWLPVRWMSGASWFEIIGVTVVGDEQEGGADLAVRKGDAAPTTVHFTNGEIYGSTVLSPDAARQRVEAVD
jgi:hypothetical protein